MMCVHGAGSVVSWLKLRKNENPLEKPKRGLMKMYRNSENGEWVLKPCKMCENLLPLDRFYQRKGLTPSNICVECTKIRDKQRATNEYKKMRKEYMKKYYRENKEKWQRN